MNPKISKIISEEFEKLEKTLRGQEKYFTKINLSLEGKEAVSYNLVLRFLLETKEENSQEIIGSINKEIIMRGIYLYLMDIYGTLIIDKLFKKDFPYGE